MKEREINLDLLEKLTFEVTKETPEPEKLKEFMQQAGLKYSEDPIERINMVLEEINFFEKKESNDEE